MNDEEALNLLEYPIKKWSMDFEERDDGLSYYDVVETAISAMRERVERNSAWISVEDILPKKQCQYLVYYKFKENDVAHFMGILTWYEYVEHPHWQHEDTGLIVTHWMPLPQPPKEDKV